MIFQIDNPDKDKRSSHHEHRKGKLSDVAILANHRVKLIENEILENSLNFA